jgi:hypothetical protein
LVGLPTDRNRYRPDMVSTVTHGNRGYRAIFFFDIFNNGHGY